MTIQEAIDILRLLAAGIDPETGEVLPEGHLLHKHPVHLSLLAALRNLMAKEQSGTNPPSAPVAPIHARRNAGRAWTEAELDTLRRLYESGVPVPDIARRLHRRPRGVRLQLNLMAGGGLQRDERVDIPDVIHASSIAVMAAANRKHGPANHNRPWTAEADTDLEMQFSEGNTIPQLAKAFGRSRYAIHRRLQRLGLVTDDGESAANQPWSAEDVEVMRRLHLSGLSAGDIAVRLSRPEAAIRARLFYMGLSKDAPALFPEKQESAPEPSSGTEASTVLPEQVASAISQARRWTPEEDVYLRHAWAEGTLIGDMCDHLRMPEAQVRCRLVYVGVTDRSILGDQPLPPELAHEGLPWYPEDIETLYYMFRQGRTPGEMAAALQRSVSVVRSRLEQLGLMDE